MNADQKPKIHSTSPTLQEFLGQVGLIYYTCQLRPEKNGHELTFSRQSVRVCGLLGRRFDSRSGTAGKTTLVKLFTPLCLCHQVV